MRMSNNPVLKEGVFSRFQSGSVSGVMTIQGVVNKTFLLLAIVIAGAAFVWSNPATFAPFMMPCILVTLGLSFAIAFKPNLVSTLAPIYAVMEGIVLGVISAFFERQFPGIVMQAVGLTFGTMFAMLAIYKTRLINPHGTFMMCVSSAVGGIFWFYLFSMIGNMFGLPISLIHGASPLSIGISFVIVGVAAFSFITDFYAIEQGVNSGAPKQMEWYGAFALMVKLIWLYMELLRLLSKLQSRR